MLHHGFVRVAAATPTMQVADCSYNVDRLLEQMASAEEDHVNLLVFPELAITGYTCADLFQHQTLQTSALASLSRLVSEGADVYSGVAVVGVPLLVEDQLFNCAVVFHQGEVLGVVPKTYLPTYKEFYESRWFASAERVRRNEIEIDGTIVPFGTNFVFGAEDVEGFVLGVEICEDLWVPIPPSAALTLAGATLLINPSASNDLIGKSDYRRQLVVGQSGRCIAGYVYSSCGVHESTTDVVFGGHCLIAENASLLAESRRFQRKSTMLVADLDLARLRSDRAKMNVYGESIRNAGIEVAFHSIPFRLRQEPVPIGDSSMLPRNELRRSIEAHPFVPRGERQLRDRCEEIFHIQVAGLARRLEQIGVPKATIGVSGGLDSTLALLVACKTLDDLGVSRTRLQAYTMPGFGTSKRTLDNARSLMNHLGVTQHEIDIRPLCVEQMRAMGHRPFGLDIGDEDIDTFTEKLRSIPADQQTDLVFENIQARTRTNILMNAGFVIGTGDVSELALGWCTYNADQMSMYNPNCSIPKTLVKFLVDWAARNEFEDEVRKTLLDIVDTVISPELLPVGDQGQIAQLTENTLGPYEVHDFFLYHFLRYGASPNKILFLAEHARFHHDYTAEQLRDWLKLFLRRFFTNQFKRSALPDGPKVGSISLSPRGDWRMPSDAQVSEWLRCLEE